MLCVMCPHTRMNPPIQRVCTLGACTQAFCACMRVLVCLLCLLARVCIMGNGQSSIKSSAVCPRLAQITVFASRSPHIGGKILVSTAQILLSIYPMDYILQIIGDNRVA